jgi:hypothetical protein
MVFDLRGVDECCEIYVCGFAAGALGELDVAIPLSLMPFEASCKLLATLPSESSGNRGIRLFLSIGTVNVLPCDDLFCIFPSSFPVNSSFEPLDFSAPFDAGRFGTARFFFVFLPPGGVRS